MQTEERMPSMAATPARYAGVPPLCSVVVACRSTPTPLDSAADIVSTIDSFIDVAKVWTVPLVCEQAVSGAIRLLPRVAAREPVEMDPILKRKLFSDALAHASRHGDLAIVSWLVEEYLPAGRIRFAVEEAARHGHLHVLQWLREHCNDRVVWNGRALSIAAAAGHWEAALWLDDHTPCSMHSQRVFVFRDAAKHGRLDVMEWICGERGGFSARDWIINHSNIVGFVEAAARNGFLEVLKWISERFDWPISHGCMTGAVSGGHLEVAKWLKREKMLRVVHMSGLLVAVKRGDLPMVSWVIQNLSIGGHRADLIEMAACHGHLEMVKFLHEECRGMEGSCAMAKAAGGGHLDVVQWLHEHRPAERSSCVAETVIAGNPYQVEEIRAMLGDEEFQDLQDMDDFQDEEFSTRSYVTAMDLAAANGHMDILQWLHDQRTDVCTIAAMDKAAGAGHLDIVQWLHTHRQEGCSYSAMDNAAAGGHMEVVDWLNLNRNEGCSSFAVAEAAANGHLDMLQYLSFIQQDRHSTRAVNSAANNGHLDVLQWLVETGRGTCTSATIAEAAAHGHTQVIAWIMSGGLAQPNTEALKNAVQGSNLETAMMIRDLGLSETSLDCFERAMANNDCEMLQFLMREYGPTTNGVQEFIEQALGRQHHYRANYFRDCLDEVVQMQSVV